MSEPRTDRRRVFTVVAGSRDGCTEALMLAHGLTINVLARLVGDRLVTAELNSTRGVWMQITDLGREALAQYAAT